MSNGPRIVTRDTIIVSEDLEQQDRISGPVTRYLDDTAQALVGSVPMSVPPGSAYLRVALPAGVTRIGWLDVETDAPILLRLNSSDGLSGTEIPVTPLITPPLSQTYAAPSPGVTPSVQKGTLRLRAGASRDGNTVSLTSVWVRNPGAATAARARFLFGGE